MGRMLRNCLRSTLKMVNAFLTMAGIGMLLYSIWMFQEWNSKENALRPGSILGQNPLQGRPFSQHVFSELPAPWFIYMFFGMGISLCLITCSGHIAAETAWGHCLSCYMFFVCLLFVLEAGVAADILLNKDWEKDFPLDPTGELDQLKKFVKDNIDICKWVGLIILFVQALSILLAMILRAVGPDPGNDYESDDEYEPVRVDLRQAFLNHPAAQTMASPQNESSRKINR